MWPFHDIAAEERNYVKVSLFHFQCTFWHWFEHEEVDFSQMPISGVFVFHDPRQWALDIQILCDVLQSGGIIGGPYIGQSSKPVELIFCNPDLLWRSAFERPRLGQGSFIQAFQAVYRVCCHTIFGVSMLMFGIQALTGSTYPYIQYGKPTAATYSFAEKVLTDRLEALYGHRRLPPVLVLLWCHHSLAPLTLSHRYMIGGRSRYCCPLLRHCWDVIKTKIIRSQVWYEIFLAMPYETKV